MQSWILDVVLACVAVVCGGVSVYFYTLASGYMRAHSRALLAHQDELSALNASHQEAINTLNASHQNELNTLNASHQEALNASQALISELNTKLALAQNDANYAKEALQASAKASEQIIAGLRNDHEQTIAGLRNDHEQTITQLRQEHADTIAALKHEHTKAQQEIQSRHDELALQARQLYAQNLATLEQKLEQNYKVQNELMLSQNTKILNDNSLKTIKDVFEPITARLAQYEKTLSEQKGVFETSFKLMVDASQNIGKKADEFASTLKGEKKIRGNFGEIILESVLSSSGLVKNEHFYLQRHYQSKDGKTLIPDAVVYFDASRCVVIDSKFSLGDDSEQIHANLKARIDELSKKDYPSHIEGAYEYAVLFVPYKNILDLALEHDTSLHEYAYSKKVFLASANVLFMGLKSILMGWNYQKQNDNVAKVFDDVAKFYDKFVGVIEELESLKKSHAKTANHIQELDKKLISGRGNLSRQISDLQSLGIKTKKLLSVEYNDELDGN